VGRALLVGRLAARDLRRRPAEVALLLLAILAATTTLTLGLVLRGVTTEPFERTRAATAGPDVLAGVAPEPGGRPADVAALESLAGAPGVVAHSGPFPVAMALLEANGRSVLAQAEGRDTAAAAVDQPETTQGGWVRDGAVVLEAAFADALGVGVGDRVRLRPISIDEGNWEPRVEARGPGRTFRVAGVAVTAASASYPDTTCVAFCLPDTGLVWLTRADAHSVEPDADARQYLLKLRLADPAAAEAFVAARNPEDGAAVPPDRFPPILKSWQEISAENANMIENQRRALLTGGWLLALLAVASVAVLVGGRMADQIRRVGLLKAVGGTPALIAAVLLAQYMVVALVAATAGLALGWQAAPLLTESSAGLLGSAGAGTVTLSTVGLVTAVALGVAVVATFVPAVRASRTSTVRALADSARPPRRTAWLIALSRRLPVPLLVGLRVAARRPRRTALAVASIAITASGIVAVLYAHADVLDDPNGVRGEQFNRVLLVIAITLVALAAVNAIFVTWATALDARRSSALTRALGATPQQVSAGLAAAQVLPALAGAVLGIPGGIALVTLVDPDATTTPPLWQLLAVVPLTALVMAALAAIPARLGARRPIVEILRSERA
jgi:ABC-type lipoprotein release transport system permease subunit